MSLKLEEIKSLIKVAIPDAEITITNPKKPNIHTKGFIFSSKILIPFGELGCRTDGLL